MKTLTEKEIEEIRKDPNSQFWYDISCNYKLSESFMMEFKDVVNWCCISLYQKLTEDFIYEFFDKLDIEWILIHQKHLSIETKNKIKVIHELSK